GRRIFELFRMRNWLLTFDLLVFVPLYGFRPSRETENQDLKTKMIGRPERVFFEKLQSSRMLVAERNI
ncbi:MAG: hypothetical protein KDC24_13470, partial [Saprospiraceae bacterium]|nr:hypothetical protein [Saprospiraceae bacterium]